jgi:ketosteroid isomerase-like protein
MNSQNQNIETVKHLYEAFGKKDINLILSLLSPDVEWGEPENPYNPAGGTRYGHNGFLEWVNIGREAEEILILEPKQFLSDENSVAVTGYLKCLAKPTGKTYESDFVHLVTLNEGKIVRFREFFDTFAAGEAFRQK